MTESKTPRTWNDGWRCNECCNGDRCDDPSHYDRARCPHCKGTGLAIWNIYAKEAEFKKVKADLAAALAAKERAEAMTHEHRSEFLGEIQRRVIELGGDPPYWPARNDIEAHDDVESAARMILELLQERDALAAKLAEAERTNVALAALVSAAKEDAGRYRWLRGDGGPSSLRWPRWCVQHWTGHWNPVSEFEMDEAIDAARSQEAKDEH